MYNSDHENAVRAFFKECREDREDEVNEVFKKYPTITSRKRRNIRRSERNVGLLGLQPANLPIGLAFELGYESQHQREDD